MTSRIVLPLLFLLALAFSSPAGESPKTKPTPAKKEIAPFSVTVTGSGPPMILIPGLACSGNVWDGTVEHFKDRYECHVLTLAGFGGQPAIGTPFLEPVRDGLIKYIAEKHLDHPIIIGHSLGGFMAFWVAATAPDQVGPIVAVDGMPFYAALLDNTATAQSIIPQAEGMRALFKDQTPEQFAFRVRGFLTGMITSPKDIAKVAEGSGKSDPKEVAQAFYELMTIDLRSKVQAIRTPVLVIGATAAVSDPGQKKEAEDNYRAEVATIAHHKVVFAAKARHFIQLDEPDYFYQEVETFLKESSAPGQ
ncbi:MAG: alpha/beta hydrolase [Chthoniobacter sp.]|uniref:alpha/beta fold hydrolase n=1 Tax=Chthoniobacter sp. TaxID=2510640 RepID=UPI0032ACEBBA